MRRRQTRGGAAGTREKMREMLTRGLLDERLVEVSVTKSAMPMMEIFSGTSMEDMELNFGNLGSIFGGKKKRKKVTVKQAREILLNEEMDKLVDMDRVSELARQPRGADGDHLHRRDRQDRLPRGKGGHRRVPGRGAEGHPAHRGRLQGEHPARDRGHPAHPVHCRRRLPHEQALGPDPRAAGTVPAARGAFSAHQGGFREDPHAAEERAHHAVHRAAEDRGGRRWSSCRRRSTGLRRSPRR